MDLPREMIQHIQSFLNAKEAARTTILSKSWYEAWLTRPHLDFSEQDFVKRTDFLKVTERTLKRYDELKLKIHRFKLKFHYSPHSHNICVVNDWIKEAMKLGATDVDIKFSLLLYVDLVLPREVLESESLVRLSLVSGRIDLEDHKVSCSSLKSLHLRNVHIQGNDICDIISKCPLIEEFALSFFSSMNLSRSFVLKLDLGVNDFHNLKVLLLDNLEIGEWLFRDLPKYPCLKELRLDGCTGYGDIQICSTSLEFIHLVDKRRRPMRAKFDVPRIRKFIFVSACVHFLCFKTTSRVWESRISFYITVVASSSWFVEFRKFLLELRSSKIYLNLSINSIPHLEGANEYNNLIGSGLPKRLMVEELRLVIINAPAVSGQSMVIKNLFWSCRPKLITEHMSCDLVKMICNTLVKLGCGMHDLEKVEVVISKQSVWRWSRPLPRKTLDASLFIQRWMLTQIYLQWGLYV